ncbi:MAG: AAA family ATPase [Synergistaceae bacterium]|nr:AAA family ATPase [Synergistaceae bacterium]
MRITSPENVIRILTGYNHWWRLGSVQAEHLKPIRRTVFQEAMKILNSADEKRILCIVGPRRTGKTTVLHQLISDLIAKGIKSRNLVYLNIGHPFFSMESLDEVLSIYFENIYLGGEESGRDQYVYFFFDDIQLSVGWEKSTKRLISLYPNIKIIMSSTITMSVHDADNGLLLMHLPPMSFYEYCQVSVKAEYIAPAIAVPEKSVIKAEPQELRALASSILPFRKQFRRYMYTGGFPRLVMEKNNKRVQLMILEAVVGETLFADIPTYFNIRDGIELYKLFFYLCLNTPGKISYEATARDLDCLARPTIEKYVGYIERANLIYLSTPTDLGDKKNQKIQPKIYLADAAILNAIMILDDLQVSQEQLQNAMEATVYRHLRFSGPDSTEVKINYYSERDKNIDMVLTGGKKLFVDVRHTDEIKLSLKTPSISMANQADISLIVTKRDVDFGHVPGLPKNVFLIPAHILLYLIGRAKTEGKSLIDEM